MKIAFQQVFHSCVVDAPTFDDVAVVVVVRAALHPVGYVSNNPVSPALDLDRLGY